MIRSTRHAASGFTLIEVLAALAIASVVIIATAALIHNVALNFDRGTGRVGRADRLLLAVERLAADFGSARLVETGATNAVAAFTGAPTEVKFVAAGGVATGPRGEEVVSLSVEQIDGASHLVRRRAAWLGPRTPFETIVLRDPVHLLDGQVDISFAYGRIAADGALTWTDTWSEQPVLPRLVRLEIRNRADGAELVPGAEFVLRADAPIACALPGAAATCLTGGKAQAAPANDAPPKTEPAEGRG